MRACADGSSECAAAMAVSMVVMHSTPSAMAAWRTAAASRTAPERGMGVLMMSEISPLGDDLEDRRQLAVVVAHQGHLAHLVAVSRRAAAVPGVATKR